MLSHLGEELLELLYPAVAPLTFFVYRLSFQKYIESMGDVDISSITPMHIELWKNRLGIKFSPAKASIYFRTLESPFQ